MTPEMLDVSKLTPSPSLHELKVWPEFFEAIWSGKKTFEIRFNDRNFQIGHQLVLREYDPKADHYSGRTVVRRVTYVTDFLQREGYVVMGLT